MNHKTKVQRMAKAKGHCLCDCSITCPCPVEKELKVCHCAGEEMPKGVVWHEYNNAAKSRAEEWESYREITAIEKETLTFTILWWGVVISILLTFLFLIACALWTVVSLIV